VLVSVRRLLTVGMLCIAASACGASGVSDSDWTAVEDQLQSAIVSSTGYPAGSIEVLASRVRVNISISDRKLARADQDAREQMADTVVTAVEESIAVEARLAAIAEIRVVIVHPEEAHGLLSSTHTEDVMDFKKGSNQQFYRDVL
jgi:hypothetical protein